MKGNHLLSGSAYSDSLKKPFPIDFILPKVAKKYGVDAEIIRAMWSANSDISLTFGNAIHYVMEQWFKYRAHGCEDKEYHMPKHPFLRGVIDTFPQKHSEVIPEVVLSSVKHGMAGRADGLCISGTEAEKSIVPWDYKTDAEIDKNLPFHFAQLSFYAFILQQFGYTIPNLVVWNFTTTWERHESEVLPYTPEVIGRVVVPDLKDTWLKPKKGEI